MNRSALSLAGQLRRPARRCLFPGARMRYRARTLALSAALLPALALASAVRADQPPLSLPEAQRLAALRSKQAGASDLAASPPQDPAAAPAPGPGPGPEAGPAKLPLSAPGPASGPPGSVAPPRSRA